MQKHHKSIAIRGLGFAAGVMLLAQPVFATGPSQFGFIKPNTSVYLRTDKARFKIQVPVNGFKRLRDNAPVTHGAVNIASLPLSGQGGVLSGPGQSAFRVTTPNGSPDICWKQTIYGGHVPTADEHRIYYANKTDVADTRVDWLNNNPAWLEQATAIDVSMNIALIRIKGDSAVTVPGLAGTFNVRVNQDPADLIGVPTGHALITASTTSPTQTTGTYSAEFFVRPKFIFYPAVSGDTIYFQPPSGIPFGGSVTTPFTLDKTALPAMGTSSMMLVALLLLLSGTVLVWSRRRREGDMSA